MRFVNRSKNTIYFGDIDLSIPFLEDFSSQEISLDLVKRSKNFRLMLSKYQLEIVENGDSLFERNLMKVQENAKTIFFRAKKEATQKPEDHIFSREKNTQPEDDTMKYSTTGKTTRTTRTEEIKASTIPTNSQIEVRIRGHFYEAGGYAKVGRNLAIGLHNHGVKVNISATNKTSNNLCEDEVRTLAKVNQNVSNNCIVIDNMIPTFSSSGGGKYRILYTTTESETIPQQFIDTANTYNEIWTVSDFCKSVLEKHLNRPVFMFPDTVDLNLYNENHEAYEFNPPLKPFTFISVFGWSYRKGYDVLLKSYLQEFTGNDPVSLLIVSRFLNDSGNQDTVSDTIKKYVKDFGGNNPAHIAKCGNIIPESQMPSLYKAAKAYVLFTRNEGFQLPAIESSLCGLPVISTNYSGQTMFLKQDNSTLIDIDRLSPLEPGLVHVHYWDNQLFPEMKSQKVLDDAKKALREVYVNYEYAQKKNEKLQKFVKENYAVEIVTKNIRDRLQTIWEKIR